jgi:hypothetical protein
MIPRFEEALERSAWCRGSFLFRQIKKGRAYMNQSQKGRETEAYASPAAKHSPLTRHYRDLSGVDFGSLPSAVAVNRCRMLQRFKTIAQQTGRPSKQTGTELARNGRRIVLRHSSVRCKVSAALRHTLSEC